MDSIKKSVICGAVILVMSWNWLNIVSLIDNYMERIDGSNFEGKSRFTIEK